MKRSEPKDICGYRPVWDMDCEKLILEPFSDKIPKDKITFVFDDWFEIVPKNYFKYDNWGHMYNVLFLILDQYVNSDNNIWYSIEVLHVL